jgi:hypothetical protein
MIIFSIYSKYFTETKGWDKNVLFKGIDKRRIMLSKNQHTLSVQLSHPCWHVLRDIYQVPEEAEP